MAIHYEQSLILLRESKAREPRGRAPKLPPAWRHDARETIFVRAGVVDSLCALFAGNKFCACSCGSLVVLSLRKNNELQSTPDNSSLQGKLKKRRVILRSSYRG